MSHLETKASQIIPPEVLAAGRVGFVRIGEETSSRIAFRADAYMRLIIHRYKCVRVEDAATIHCNADIESSPVVIARVPESVWANVMADPSAITHVLVAKYDVLPLHRQRRSAPATASSCRARPSVVGSVKHTQ